MNETSIEAYHTMLSNLPNSCCSSYGHTIVKNLMELGPHHRTLTNFIRRRPHLLHKNWLIFNVHINGNHWAVLVVNTIHRTISYYDSLHSDGTNYTTAMHVFLDQIERNEAETTGSTWQECPQAHSDLPLQVNGTDCGLYAMLKPQLLFSNIPLNVLTPTVAQRARIYIATFLLTGSLGDMSMMLSTHSLYTSGPGIPMSSPATPTPGDNLTLSGPEPSEFTTNPVTFQMGSPNTTTQRRSQRLKVTATHVSTTFSPPIHYDVTIQDPARLTHM